MTCKIEENDDVHHQLIINVQDVIHYSLALNESTDSSDIAHLTIFVRGLDKDLNVTEELAALRSMCDTTKGELINIVVVSSSSLKLG